MYTLCVFFLTECLVIKKLCISYLNSRDRLPMPIQMYSILLHTELNNYSKKKVIFISIIDLNLIITLCIINIDKI